jgi:hypothetical protein
VLATITSELVLLTFLQQALKKVDAWIVIKLGIAVDDIGYVLRVEMIKAQATTFLGYTIEKAFTGVMVQLSIAIDDVC